MDESQDGPIQDLAGSPVDESPKPRSAVNRRDLLRLTLGGGAGLALDGLLDVPAMRAATQNLKLSDISEFTTSCNFCSCGCGMIAAVRDGKLITMEGDYDHIVNRGSLCVKGISMFATHASPKRLTDAPVPGAGQRPLGGHLLGGRGRPDRAEDPQDARRDLDRHREGGCADLVVDRAAGDRLQSAPRFVPHEGPLAEVPVNRTDAIAFLGGAQNTNEECYLFQKAARLLGLAYVEHQARL